MLEEAVTHAPDPLSLLGRAATKLNTKWLELTYPFALFGRSVSIHYACDLSRIIASHIEIGDGVFAASAVWFNVVRDQNPKVKIVLKNGCRIGRRCTISAKNYIEIGEDVLMAPSVLIMDHNHEYRNHKVPIHSQGVTAGGRITIGCNCWLGYGCVISCDRGELSVGRNSVLGAGTVLTTSIPPFSVVVGNPARIVKQYDFDSAQWRRPLS
jgi:acetyltransferase-like isoleucine patch superfamily enzyme